MTAPDLTAIYDHPAVLLRDHYNESTKTLQVTRPSLHENMDADPVTVQDAINVLRQYEAEHKITFTALDNDTLTALREVYEQARLGSGYDGQRLIEVYGLIGDLLGLDQ